MPTLYGLDFTPSVHLEDVIGASSLVIAACRAAESERSDALFVDPLAKYFSGQRNAPLPALLLSYMVCRTHFIDMELMDALTHRHAAAPPNAVVPKQVVLLGAGMDARHWRLPTQEGAQPPADTVFELDQKEVLEAKDTVLAQVGEHGKLPAPRLAEKRVTLAVDISDPKWIQTLLSAGYDPAKGTVWILEGFLRFFSNQQIDALLEQLSYNSAVGSSILVTVPSEESRRQRVENDPADAEKQWRFGTEDPVAYFSRFGWKAVKHFPLEKLEVEYNRVPQVENGEDIDPSKPNAGRGSDMLRAVKVA